MYYITLEDLNERYELRPKYRKEMLENKLKEKEKILSGYENILRRISVNIESTEKEISELKESIEKIKPED